MIIWFAYLIPILTALTLAVFWVRKMAWWEWAVLMVIPTIIIAIVAHASKAGQVKAVEYYGGYVTDASYDEPWNEWIVEECSSTSCTGSGKDERCTTTYYDCSYCNEHGPSWNYNTSIGEGADAQTAYNVAVATFRNKKFVNLRRNSECPNPVNGNRWIVKFPGNSAHLLPYFKTHQYENRVQAAPTLFSFPRIDTSKTKVFEYPNDEEGLNHSSVLADKSFPNYGKASDLLSWYNAEYGAAFQVHAWLIVFHDRTRQSGLDQEAYWKGGGKNELITTVGLDKDQKVKWCYVFSWSPKKEPSIVIRDSIMSMGVFDGVKAVELIGQQGIKKFHRKHFKDFAYVSIEPTNGAVILAFILTMLFCIGWGFFSVKNGIDVDD